MSRGPVAQRAEGHRSFLLEIRSRDALLQREFPPGGVVVARATPDGIARSRRLWTTVGAGFWSERGDWRIAQWRGHLANPDVSFWIATLGGEDVGFFELIAGADGIKIEGFGLLPQWRGAGLGGGLLTAAARQAFELGAKRVWLHTATDDHPNALPNYLKRGFLIYHEEALESPMPGALSDSIAGGRR